MARRYTEEQREWLLLHFSGMTNRELAEAFEERFGIPTTYEAMHSFGSNRHLRKDPEATSRALSKAQGGLTEEEKAFIVAHVPGHSRSETTEAFRQRFGRTLTKGQIENVKHRSGVRSGVNAGHFKKGRPSETKGKTWDEIGYTPEQQERMRANLFKKGELNDHNRARMRSLLDTKEGPDGHLMIYVRPRNAPWPARHWISYARFVWMRANGRDWPEGHRVVFADHDNRNFDPENVVAVPDELAIIIQGKAHGRALPYHDRESLEVAINHARVIRARYAAEQRLRSASRPPAR